MKTLLFILLMTSLVACRDASRDVAASAECRGYERVDAGSGCRDRASGRFVDATRCQGC